MPFYILDFFLSDYRATFGLVLLIKNVSRTSLTFEWLQVDLASEERLLIRTTAFVEELRKRMYTKVCQCSSSIFNGRCVHFHSWLVLGMLSQFVNWTGFWSLQVILMDHVDWLEQDDIDVLCAALKDQVKVRMDRKYVFYWNWESYSMWCMRTWSLKHSDGGHDFAAWRSCNLAKCITPT